MSVNMVTSKFRIKKALWKMAVVATLPMVSLSMAAASSEETGDEENLPGRYKSIIYGVVEKTPLGHFGNWVINKRDVTVTKETRFIEKHGKAVVGAYVEVEGENTAMSFTASKIEVKRSKPR